MDWETSVSQQDSCVYPKLFSENYLRGIRGRVRKHIEVILGLRFTYSEGQTHSTQSVPRTDRVWGRFSLTRGQGM